MKILAFDIGGTNIKYALCNEKFNITDRHTVPTEAEKGGQELVQKVIRIIESYDDIDRIAISTAGQVDSKNGIVVYSTGNIPYYTGMMVKKIIENKTGILTYVENDVNAFALVLHTEQVSAVHYFLITSFIKATAHLPVNSAI